MADAPSADRIINRKARVGTVVSDKNDQTVIVSIERASRHRLYRKVIRSTKRYPVHDPENQATVGDLVRIEECRPISKTKRWRLVEVLTEREVAEIAPESIGETLVDEMQRSAARAAAEEADEGGEPGAPGAAEAAHASPGVAPEPSPAADAPAADAAVAASAGGQPESPEVAAQVETGDAITESEGTDEEAKQT